MKRPSLLAVSDRSNQYRPSRSIAPKYNELRGFWQFGPSKDPEGISRRPWFLSAGVRITVASLTCACDHSSGLGRV